MGGGQGTDREECHESRASALKHVGRQEGRSDAEVLAEHMALGDLAEPLGFDSLFALEHHFTGYAMSRRRPTALLSYYAGPHEAHRARHRRHRPAVARSCAGGRGDRAPRRYPAAAASSASAGRGQRSSIVRVPWRECAARASSKQAKIVVKALTNPVFDWRWRVSFKIPRTSIRPRPISHPERRFLCLVGEPGVR